MMGKQNEQVDFSNVTFSDFGKLSPAQKVGFLITLPIALPVIALVKCLAFLSVSNAQNLNMGSVDNTESSMGRTSYIPPVGSEFEYELDSCAFGEDYAEQNHRW